MDFITEMQIKLFEAHKEFVKECFADYTVMVAERTAQDVEEMYPEGFKDFLLEKIQNRIGALKSQGADVKAVEE